MSGIYSAQSIIKTLQSRLVIRTLSVRSRIAKLTTDVFDRQSNDIGRVNDYLSNVVFEKVGRIFPKIKATYQGKLIATTKKELFEQLNSFDYNSETLNYHPVTGEAARGIKKNIANLGKNDIFTMARLSKFFTQVSKHPNSDFEYLKIKITYDKNKLSTIDKLLIKYPDMNIDDLTKIANSVYNNNLEYFEIILNSNPQKLDVSSMISYIEKLPLDTKAIEENIAINKRIIEKLENVEDEKIKEFINLKLTSGLNLNEQLKIPKNCYIPAGGFEELDKCEALLDAYHCENSSYSMINGDANEYYKFLKTEANPELADRIHSEIQLNPYHLMKSHRQGLPISEPVVFYEAVRLEPIKQFIGMYSKTEPEMANYLYEKYFLTKMVDCELKRKCTEINKEFGTKVFVDIYTDASMLSKIYAELMNWRIASEGKARIPYVFDTSRAKQEFVDKEDIVTSAFCRRKDSSINMPAKRLAGESAISYIRHEMTHLNDSEFCREGIINGINIEAIIKEQKYKSELEAAGICGHSLKYAYKDKNEFIAVAAQGNCRKYSQEFKQVLIKLGMPEWVFELKKQPIPIGMAQKLEDEFITLARIGKNGDYDSIFPNGIMLTGNDFILDDIAEWLAKESDCKLEKVDFTNISQEEAMRELLTISNKAKENSWRTLIQINNFERFTIPTLENRRIIAGLKSFLSGCAKDKKCTVIAQTDDISKIDDIVMADHRFQVRIDSNGNNIW